MRVHREALQLQRDFYSLCLHASNTMGKVQLAFEALDASRERSMMVYRKAMERYPGSKKLLNCYGRFQVREQACS